MVEKGARVWLAGNRVLRDAAERRVGGGGPNNRVWWVRDTWGWRGAKRCDGKADPRRGGRGDKSRVGRHGIRRVGRHDTLGLAGTSKLRLAGTKNLVDV